MQLSIITQIVKWRIFLDFHTLDKAQKIWVSNSGILPILTDSIHIIELSHKNYPLWAIILVLIPQYTLFIVAGFEAYVISLIRLDNYLTNLVTHKYIIAINGIFHSLSVVGIYLGRFERFNSWDLVSKPGNVLLTITQDLLNGEKILSMAIAFLLIWLLTEFTKLVNYKIGLETVLT